MANPKGVNRTPSKKQTNEERNQEDTSKKEVSLLMSKLGEFVDSTKNSLTTVVDMVGDTSTLTHTASVRFFGGLEKFAEDAVSGIRKGWDEIGQMSSSFLQWGRGLFGQGEDVPGGSPTKGEMSKTRQGRAALFMVDALTEKDREFNKVDRPDPFAGVKGFFSNMGPNLLKLGSTFKKQLAGMGKGLTNFMKSKTASVMGIVAGAAMMAGDAIAGAKKADEWGVSKAEGAAGAALGGMSKGMEGAFQNAGKWALMGFGIGNLIVPGLGGIIGGAAGALIGAILGWFGGEAIAKAFGPIGKWIGNFFTKTIPEGFKKGFSSLSGFFSKVGDIGKAIFDFMGKGGIPGWILRTIIMPTITKIASWADENKDKGGLATLLHTIFSSITKLFTWFNDKLSYIMADDLNFGQRVARIGDVMTGGNSKESKKHDAVREMSRVLQGEAAEGDLVSDQSWDSLSKEKQDTYRAKYKQETGAEFAYAQGGISSTPQLATLSEFGQKEWVIPETKLPSFITDGSLRNMQSPANTSAELKQVVSLLSSLLDATKKNGAVYVPYPVESWTSIS